MCFKNAATGESAFFFVSAFAYFLASIKLHNTGVSVSATNVEAQSAVMKATPSGTSIFPSIPLNQNKGIKLTIIIRVE